MLLAGILTLASLMLSLWSATITGDIIFDEEELGSAVFTLDADYMDVSVTLNFTIDDESVETGANIGYADLNYTTDPDEWLFGTSNETTPADAVTLYIFPVMLILTILSGLSMLFLAFVNPKKSWPVWIVLILIFVAILYFFYAWDMFLSHLNMEFFNESGALLGLPEGVTVSGNPSFGFYLLIGGLILTIVSVYRTRKELFGKEQRD